MFNMFCVKSWCSCETSVQEYVGHHVISARGASVMDRNGI